MLNAAARNAFRRYKTLRHPSILLYVDGHEPAADAKSGRVLVVTEHVTPLQTWLANTAKDQQKESIAGLLLNNMPLSFASGKISCMQCESYTSTETADS